MNQAITLQYFELALLLVAAVAAGYAARHKGILADRFGPTADALVQTLEQGVETTSPPALRTVEQVVFPAAKDLGGMLADHIDKAKGVSQTQQLLVQAVGTTLQQGQVPIVPPAQPAMAPKATG